MENNMRNESLIQNGHMNGKNANYSSKKERSYSVQGNNYFSHGLLKCIIYSFLISIYKVNNLSHYTDDDFEAKFL